MKTVPRPKLEQQPFHKGVVPNFDEDRQIDSRNTQNRLWIRYRKLLRRKPKEQMNLPTLKQGLYDADSTICPNS